MRILRLASSLLTVRASVLSSSWVSRINAEERSLGRMHCRAIKGLDGTDARSILGSRCGAVVKRSGVDSKGR
jgi:hypothetical protein